MPELTTMATVPVRGSVTGSCSRTPRASCSDIGKGKGRGKSRGKAVVPKRGRLLGEGGVVPVVVGNRSMRMGGDCGDWV